VYLPLYLAGIMGPTLSSVLVGAGIDAPFRVAGAVLVVSGAHVTLSLVWRRSR
jgi:hypothetical protein